MGKKLILGVVILLTMLTCSKSDNDDTGGLNTDTKQLVYVQPAVCMFFLSTDTKKNDDLYFKIKTAANSENYSVIVISIAPGQYDSAFIKDIMTENDVTDFPAVVVGGKIRADAPHLAQALQQAHTNTQSAVHPLLETDAQSTEISFSVCCDKDLSLENGRVVILMTHAGSIPELEDEANIVLSGIVADEKDYNVAAGSCHVPVVASWKFFEQSGRILSSAIMLVLDNSGYIVAGANIPIESIK